MHKRILWNSIHVYTILFASSSNGQISWFTLRIMYLRGDSSRGVSASFKAVLVVRVVVYVFCSRD